MSADAVEGRMVEVLAFDPGVTTGWARGRVWVAPGLATDEMMGVVWDRQAGEFTHGDAARAARECFYMIAGMFEESVERGGGRMPWETWVVIEDFTLYKMGSTGKTGIAPARVGMYLAGMLAGVAWERARRVDPGVWGPGGPRGGLRWYEPAARGSREMTDRRLRELGLWEPGLGHARDAWKLFVHHVRQLR